MTLHFGTDQDLLCDSCRGHYWTGGVAQVVVHLPSKPEFKHQYWKKKKVNAMLHLLFWKKSLQVGRGEYWGLNSGPTPWVTLPTTFCDGFLLR
jgi:hypothetical protein